MSKPTVAVVGANRERSRYSNKSLRAHVASGYEAFPVNPAGGEIEKLKVYERVSDIPVERLDRVTMYVRPQIGINLLDDIAQKGCDELWLNPGTSSPELLARARELGLNPIEGCSIVDLGRSPSEFN